MNFLLALAVCFAPSLQPRLDDVAALRAEGPPALARLLERYRSQPPGPAHDALEATIDAVSAQRYASVSGLYWYTDLPEAEQAARTSGKPILSLRMLGRLDEELSCANSRFFRVALYANREVSAFLRDNFVLHWSSERPVPKVTIDFGDGRAIHTTLAGNSAHYVLDSDGHVIDVLPGLYSPVAFQRELEALLPLARTSPTLDDGAREARVKEFLRAHDMALGAFWRNHGERIPPQPIPGIIAAEFVSVSKAAGESSMLAQMLPDALDSGSGMYRGTVVRRRDEAGLDASSLALFDRLVGARLSAPERAFEIANFELAIAADTQQNELRLRPMIHRLIQSHSGLLSFAELNDLVYDQFFLTPRADPWLGLRAPGIFTGLTDDGVRR